MKTSEQINELAAALAKAQSVFQNPPRNRTVKVKTKSGGEYSFDYATLDAILDLVREPLASNGLAVTQIPDSGEKGITLITRVMHSSGQYIEASIPVLPTEPGPQALGSALTYVRRYALTSMLGLAAEEDDDANHAAGNHSHRQERPSQQRKPQGNGQKPEPPADSKPTEPALTTKDNKIIAEIVQCFSEAKSESECQAILDMIAKPDSSVRKADHPEQVKRRIWDTVKHLPHMPKKRQAEPDYVPEHAQA